MAIASSLPVGSWLSRQEHHDWLVQEGRRLVEFYRAARHPSGGFGALNNDGVLPAGAIPDTVLTARMVHCFSLAAMQGIPGTADLAKEGIDALLSLFHDDIHGGWFSVPAAMVHDASGEPPDSDTAKMAYLHVFVCLAAATAHMAHIPNADRLLANALEILETHFWCDRQNALIDGFSRDWQHQEAYRGANSNMHATELFLALADVLDEPLWRQRALAIVTRIIHNGAAQRDGYLLEHFDAHWQAEPDYNRDHPCDQFRPFGVTPGHACEWSRLMLELEAALHAHDEPVPEWLFHDAEQLFAAGIQRGWHVDDAPGLIYTHDLDGSPVIRQRIHWTVAEAASAASAFLKRTGDERYESLYRSLWDYIARYVIDRQHGSWRHELDAANRPDHRIWEGKPDLYHALQCTLIPRYPMTPALAVAIARG